MRFSFGMIHFVRGRTKATDWNGLGSRKNDAANWAYNRFFDLEMNLLRLWKIAYVFPSAKFVRRRLTKFLEGGCDVWIDIDTVDFLSHAPLDISYSAKISFTLKACDIGGHYVFRFFQSLNSPR